MRPIDEEELRRVLLDRIVGTKDKRRRKGLVAAICEARQMPTLPIFTLDDLRPKGRWVKRCDELGIDRGWACSICKGSVYSMTYEPYEYCPSCGAKMDQEV